jgi:DNA-binding SARP family transcriptional activator/tetratricopeptide (TPR) repeat protein
VEFGVLGPLEVNGGGVVLPAKQRVLLAVLLLRANRVVPVAALIDAVWEDAPPSSARVTLQGYVKQLRQSLGVQAAKRIVTRSPGYLMVVAAGELDLDRFTESCDQARSAVDRGDWPGAARVFADAVSLWRGDPLADVPAAAVQRTEVPRLAELRMRAVESRVEAGLRLGRHRELVAELRGLAGGEPLREGLHGHLMLALYRCGRQAEALDVFRSIDQRLRGELGISAGPELQQLHQRILTADPSLTDGQASGLDIPRERAVASSAAGPSEPLVVPRQLPGAVPHFIGRADELKALASLLEDGGKVPGTAVITALGGMGGVGKTALAVYWAHQVAAAFPDGQLYVDLRGFSPDTVPVAPAEAVCGFLEALGVPSSRVPASAEAQYALYRSLIADKRLLVVLDNARDAAQVRPLLPGTTSCVTLVTSRRRLTSLAAAEGAHIVDLDVFDPLDARELLSRRLGTRPSEAQADAVDELIELCSGLPLALSIAAARAAGSPDRLVSVVEDLRRERDRLAALNAGDLVTDVRAVFSWSFHELDHPVAWMFRVLGLHPGPSISVPAAASMAGYSPGDARRALQDLTGAHLLTASSPGRYAMHDLLLSYAAQQARDLPDTDRRAATRRMMDHYLHSGFIASQRVPRRRPPIALRPPAPGVATEALADAREALVWIQREIPVLIAVARRAAELGFDTEAWQIPWTFTQFLHQSGRWQELISSLLTALSAAGRTGHQEGQAHMHAALGLAYSRLGAFDEAQTHLTDALVLRTAINDLDGQINVHLRLSVTYEARGLLQDALDHALKALELSRTGDNSYVGDALSAVAWCSALCGEFERALPICDESMRWYETAGNSHGQASVLDTRGYSYQHLGQHDLAIDCYQQSAEIFRDVGDRYSEATILNHLGDAHNDVAAMQAARDAWQQALVILESLGHVDAEKVRAKIQASRGLASVTDLPRP